MRGNRNARPIHASKLEDTILKDLDDRGIKYEYEPTTFTYQRPVRGSTCTSCGHVGGTVLRRYTPDIRIGNVYVEIKGKFTGENRAKMEDFLKGNPGIDLRFIFQRDNWLTAKHKNKYSDWAEKLGIKYVVGTKVPEEWVVPGDV